MATTTRMFCFVLVMVLMGCCCSAKIYKMGDSKGWTAKHGTYYDWAKRNEFQVGDSLMFQYDGNVNDVTQVSSRLEYQFCNSLSPKAVYNTGHDVVTLREPGYHFFITSNHSQCVAGQKLLVLVVHDHPIPPPPPPRKILPFGKDYKVGDSNEWSTTRKHIEFRRRFRRTPRSSDICDGILTNFRPNPKKLSRRNSVSHFRRNSDEIWFVGMHRGTLCVGSVRGMFSVGT
ncbi:hypothetical protein F2Q69_00046338 [Brassica cretica]|uniref:Phytocyanin domain-containing protein n=1 Tax=Brassica cretica TaxID=69181 RepID=A0A8S9PTI2_BRACR|nr:hypothetical protein F2Q69_00046338 [Brassica cretica]